MLIRLCNIQHEFRDRSSIDRAVITTVNFLFGCFVVAVLIKVAIFAIWIAPFVLRLLATVLAFLGVYVSKLFIRRAWEYDFELAAHLRETDKQRREQTLKQQCIVQKPVSTTPTPPVPTTTLPPYPTNTYTFTPPPAAEKRSLGLDRDQQQQPSAAAAAPTMGRNDDWRSPWWSGRGRFHGFPATAPSKVRREEDPAATTMESSTTTASAKSETVKTVRTAVVVVETVEEDENDETSSSNKTNPVYQFKEDDHPVMTPLTQEELMELSLPLYAEVKSISSTCSSDKETSVPQQEQQRPQLPFVLEIQCKQQMHEVQDIDDLWRLEERLVEVLIASPEHKQWVMDLYLDVGRYLDEGLVWDDLTESRCATLCVESICL